jgi:hypothetical protein
VIPTVSQGLPYVVRVLDGISTDKACRSELRHHIGVKLLLLYDT